MLRWLMRGVATAPLLCFVPLALGHGEWPAKHGGLMNDGETSFELVAKGRSIALYLEDHGVPIRTQDASGTLTVTRSARTWTAPVRPDGANRLRSSLATSLARDDRVVVKVRLANGSVVAGRFQIR